MKTKTSTKSATKNTSTSTTATEKPGTKKVRKTATKKKALSGLDLVEQVRQRAYELYLQRGRKSGFEMADWLQAEKELRMKKGAGK